MALEKLRDDDGVVQDRIGSQAMIFLEGHDEARQIVTGDRVDRTAVAEELPEAVEHGFIFAMSVGLFQRIDLLQVFSDGDVQCRLLDRFAGCFKPGDTQFAAFQFMVLAPLYLECLSGSDASTHTTASAAHVPLDIVAAIGDGVPVVVAFGIAGDGKHLPAAANFDAFDDVDSRQNVSPASRILADSMGDSTWSKRQKTKGEGRSWHSTTELLPPSGCFQRKYKTFPRLCPLELKELVYIRDS